MLSGYFMNENRNVYINEIDRISIVRDGKKKLIIGCWPLGHQVYQS